MRPNNGEKNILSQRFLSSKDGKKMYGDLIKIYQTQRNILPGRTTRMGESIKGLVGKETQLKTFPSTPDGISKLLGEIMSNPRQSQFSQLNKVINNAKNKAF